MAVPAADIGIPRFIRCTVSHSHVELTINNATEIDTNILTVSCLVNCAQAEKWHTGLEVFFPFKCVNLDVKSPTLMNG